MRLCGSSGVGCSAWTPVLVGLPLVGRRDVQGWCPAVEALALASARRSVQPRLSCTLAISIPPAPFHGGRGTIFSPGDDGPSINCRTPRSASYASKRAGRRRRRSRIIIRRTKAITTPSCSGRFAPSAAIVIKACGRSTSAAIATRSATTATRSIALTRLIAPGGRPGPRQALAFAFCRRGGATKIS
jgi:hypothetical protein